MAGQKLRVKSVINVYKNNHYYQTTADINNKGNTKLKGYHAILCRFRIGNDIFN